MIAAPGRSHRPAGSLPPDHLWQAPARTWPGFAGNPVVIAIVLGVITRLTSECRRQADRASGRTVRRRRGVPERHRRRLARGVLEHEKGERGNGDRGARCKRGPAAQPYHAAPSAERGYSVTPRHAASMAAAGLRNHSRRADCGAPRKVAHQTFACAGPAW